MRYRQFADAPTRRTATRFTLVCVLPPSANSLAIQKKCGPNPNRIDLVEAAGVEPASKQGAPRLSTRLFCAWSSCAGWPQTTWPFAAVS